MKKIINLLLILTSFVSLSSTAQIGARSTNFKPEVHGLKFVNSFTAEIINDIRMSGFCGGMVYAELDYFKANKPVPVQTYKPATGSPLYEFIWGRQRSSVLDNADKWGELFFNPFGSRNTEFFNWGLQGFNGGRLQELKTEIDKGDPVPLGLFKPGNGGVGPHHQVLAIGYNGGRYKGDLGNFKEDLEIMVCDPNFPTLTKILKANPAKQIYYYKDEPDNTSCQWHTYFVNKKYNMVTPPPVNTKGIMMPPGNEFLLEITTGGDDLRGGNDNVSVIIKLKGGKPEQKFANINKGARWINNYTETIPLTLATGIKKEDIESITLLTSFGGGIGGDNWNLDRILVKMDGAVIAQQSGKPLVRFTGDNTPFVLKIN
jgi:hypothetical protein